VSWWVDESGTKLMLQLHAVTEGTHVPPSRSGSAAASSFKRQTRSRGFLSHHVQQLGRQRGPGGRRLLDRNAAAVHRVPVKVRVAVARQQPEQRACAQFQNSRLARFLRFQGFLAEYMFVVQVAIARQQPAQRACTLQERIRFCVGHRRTAIRAASCTAPRPEPWSKAKGGDSPKQELHHALCASAPGFSCTVPVRQDFTR